MGNKKIDAEDKMYESDLAAIQRTFTAKLSENVLVTVEEDDKIHYHLASEGVTLTVCGLVPGDESEGDDEGLPTCPKCAEVAMPGFAWNDRFRS